MTTWMTSDYSSPEYRLAAAAELQYLQGALLSDPSLLDALRAWAYEL